MGRIITGQSNIPMYKRIVGRMEQTSDTLTTRFRVRAADGSEKSYFKKPFDVKCRGAFSVSANLLLIRHAQAIFSGFYLIISIASLCGSALNRGNLLKSLTK